MTKIKEKISVSTLEGEALAYWVARARGWEKVDSEYNRDIWDCGNGSYVFERQYHPDINGGQAMELAKAFNLRVDFDTMTARSPDNVTCEYTDYKSIESAICRAVVASVFGEYVDKEQDIV